MPAHNPEAVADSVLQSSAVELAKAGLTRDRLIDEIVTTFAIAPAKRTRVKDYYLELEAGVLDPSGVSSSLWELLGRVLGADPSLLVDAARGEPAPERALQCGSADGLRALIAGRQAGRCRSLRVPDKCGRGRRRRARVRHSMNGSRAIQRSPMPRAASTRLALPP